MNDNKKASNALLKGIKNIVQTEINKAPLDKTVTGIISNINNDNTYNVLINNQEYDNLPSMFSDMSIDDVVKIKIPQNQYSLMYIEGKINMKLNTSDSSDNHVLSINGKTGHVLINEDKTYVYNQITNSEKWEINHNLNKFPAVSVVDDNNNKIIGDIIYLSENNIAIIFSHPITGKAFLN